MQFLIIFTFNNIDEQQNCCIYKINYSQPAGNSEYKNLNYLSTDLNNLSTDLSNLNNQMA